MVLETAQAIEKMPKMRLAVRRSHFAANVLLNLDQMSVKARKNVNSIIVVSCELRHFQTAFADLFIWCYGQRLAV